MNIIFAVNVVMVINIAIHKAFISHGLVNSIKAYVNKFMQIKSKKGKA